MSLLPCPKHYIRFPRKTKPSNGILAWSPFPFLKPDIISRDDMCKQRLDFIDRKESSGANTNNNGFGQES
jgi:hypothetical protein